MLLASFLLSRALTANLRRLGSSIDWELSLTASSLDCVFLVWFLASGAAIGSFVNVMAYRMPQGISINGISRCPYCHTSLSAFENWPIFGWFRIRGRCKTCRLPISPRYLLVELWMMVVFGAIYFTEFMTGGSNLPSQAFHHLSLERLTMGSSFVPLLLLYLWCESGLVAIALFTLTRKAVPTSLVFWIVLPCFVVPIVQPSVIQVDWQTWIGPSSRQIEPHMNAVLTVILGGFVGAIIALALVAVIRVLKTRAPKKATDADAEAEVVTATDFQERVPEVDVLTIDRPEIYTQSVLATPIEKPEAVKGSKSSSTREFIACIAIAGALLGWQAAVVIAPLSMIFSTVINLGARRFKRGKLARESTCGKAMAVNSNVGFTAYGSACAVWLAVLLYRALWYVVLS